MPSKIIGRDEEKGMLKKLLQSKQPELVAIYGRRRVGKTYLIKTFFEKDIVFSCTGQHHGNTEHQLYNFSERLKLFFPRLRNQVQLTSWQEAFVRLREGLQTIKRKGKKVVFIDELPWLESHKSGFLSSFSYFWNEYAAEMKDIIIIICGSAASWIIDKVINDKGGLHNRITKRIRLLPFTLYETEQYLLYKKIKYSYYDLLQLYMIIGGIPAYLNEVQRGKSIAQNVESICFSKDGILAGEFDNLYAALFNASDRHIQVVQALAKKNKGLTRQEILEATKLITGGALSKVLHELTESGFVDKFYPFGKKEKDSLYRLTDEFSLFYFRFMQGKRSAEKNQWLLKQASPAFTIWSGYAFESVCMKHIQQIKGALQIGAVQTDISSWVFAGNKYDKGAQVDVLIDRADNVINICEMKFSTTEFKIDKRYCGELQRKKEVFKKQSGTRKTMALTLITTYGVHDNAYKEQLVDAELKMEDLFKP